MVISVCSFFSCLFLFFLLSLTLFPLTTMFVTTSSNVFAVCCSNRTHDTKYSKVKILDKIKYKNLVQVINFPLYMVHYSFINILYYFLFVFCFCVCWKIKHRKSVSTEKCLMYCLNKIHCYIIYHIHQHFFRPLCTF